MEAAYAMETSLMEETARHTCDGHHPPRSRAAVATEGLGGFPLQICCRKGHANETGLDSH